MHSCKVGQCFGKRAWPEKHTHRYGGGTHVQAARTVHPGIQWAGVQASHALPITLPRRARRAWPGKPTHTYGALAPP